MNDDSRDVIATPVADKGPWWLTDRSGRSLGAIKNAPGSPEVTVFPNRSSPLDGHYERHPSLDDAFKAIADHMGGTCELNPGMKD